MRKLRLLVLGLLCGILLPLSTQAIENGIYEVEGGHKTVVWHDNIWGDIELTVASGNLEGSYQWGTTGPSQSHSEDINARGGASDSVENGFSPNPINFEERQGPCGSGRHVPSRGEWNNLFIARCNLDKNCNARYRDEPKSGISGDLVKESDWTETNKMVFVGIGGSGFVYENDFPNIFREKFNMMQTDYEKFWTSSVRMGGVDGFVFETFVTYTPGSTYYPYSSIVLNGGNNRWRGNTNKVRCFSNYVIEPKFYHIVTFINEGEHVRSGDVESGVVIPSEVISQYDLTGRIKTGYNFSGWAISGSEDMFAVENDVVTTGMTLNAVWELTEYEIDYNLNDGTESRTNPTRYTVESGTFGLYQPIKTGYMFLGWTGSNGTEPNANVYITGGSTGTRAYNAVWGSFEDINAYFISDTGAVSYITLMDRNMGASMTGEGPDASTGSYGFHYQWGNNYGFSVLGNVYAGTYNDFKVGWNAGYENKGYNGSIFIKGSPYYDYWVGNNHYDGLWGGSGDAQNNDRGLNTITSENIINRQGPCPDGYHVPSAGEWDKLLIFWIASYSSGSSELNTGDGGLKYLGNESLITSFYNDFSISFAGSRFTNDAVLKDQIFSTVFWTSSPYSSNYPRRARDFYIKSDNLNVGSYDGRSYGLSLRCFSNDYLFTQSSMTIHPNGGTGAMVLVEGDNIKSLGTPKKTNSVFEGWYDADSEGNKIETGSRAPTNLYARWSCASGYVENNSGTGCIELYTITYELNDGVLSGENVTGYTIESEDITFINPTKTGYIFTGRSGTSIQGVTGAVTIPTGSTGNRSYEANWDAIIYTITYELDGGTNNPDNVTGYTIESDITFKDPTKDGYNFDGWFTDVQFTTGITAIPVGTTGSITIYAKWTENKKLSGGSSGGGGGGGGGSSITTNDGQNETSKNDVSTGATIKEPETNTGNKVEIETGSQIPQNDTSSGANVKDSVISMDSSVDKSASAGQSYSPEFQQAYEFAHEKGITTMPTIEKANMDGKLTRIAMAKMLSQYAMNVLGQKPANLVVPKFNDVTEKMDTDYDDGVTLAYQLGIMGQNMPNNNFRPNDEVTRAEFATALSRMAYGTSDGEYKGTGKYYIHHMEKLVKEGIITKDDPNMKELRGYVMIMLMRSAK